MLLNLMMIKLKELPYTGPGKIINSEFLNDIDIEKAKEKLLIN